MNLEESFIKYKDITLIITEIVKVEEYEKLEEMFQRRQLILDDIDEMGYTKEELKKLYLKYEIDKLDKTIESEMIVKREDLLEKIKDNKKKQTGIAGYNNLSSKAVYLSKEIY